MNNLILRRANQLRQMVRVEKRARVSLDEYAEGILEAAL